jgi:hypothetical protein
MKLFTHNHTPNCISYTLGRLGKFSLITAELEDTEFSLVLGYYRHWAAIALNIYVQKPRWNLDLEIASSTEGLIQFSVAIPGIRLSMYLGSIWYRYSEDYLNF